MQLLVHSMPNTLLGGLQHAIERYWCLRWLQQQDISRVDATVIKEDLVRFNNAPLVTRVGGMGESYPAAKSYA